MQQSMVWASKPPHWWCSRPIPKARNSANAYPKDSFKNSPYMPKKSDLDIMATNMVGDGGKPNRYFVSLNGKVVGVHTSFRSSYEHWKEVSSKNPEKETALEDRMFGVIASVEPDEELGGMLIRHDDSGTFK